MDSQMSTPVNTVSRENLHVLIRNNVLNDSVEFYSDSDGMDTDSPIRNPSIQPVSKKLFHSPMADSPPGRPFLKQSEQKRRAKKRKQTLLPDSSEKIQKVYVKECDREGYSPDLQGGMRKKVLISLFHNKEYSMDFS